MVNARGIARLGMLAVGMGIGAALANSPVASADSSTDWLASIDTLLSGLSVPAADSSDLNLAISIDGISLFQSGSAYAYSGSDGDIAIANGVDTTATAYGTDDYAVVDGTDASATAGGDSTAGATGSTDDTAFVYGDDDTAFAGGTAGSPGIDDGAIIFGNNDVAEAGSSASSAGNYDIAYAEGNNLGTADALGQSWFIDILKVYGDSTTATAADSSNFLTDATSAADSGNLVTDLLSAIDPAAAADSGNLVADLVSLF
jgi:hypothetical protein